MAYAFVTNDSFTAVPTIAGNNTFSGKNTFTGTTDSTSTTTGTIIVKGGLGVQGALYANQVWGAVWNDLADCIDVPDDTDLEFGRCYCFDGSKYYKSSKYLDDGIIGMHSDTAGFFMGRKPDKTQMRVGVAGFILAYVDQVYPVGTPLTCTENGALTKIDESDIAKNPHKIVGTFWKRETSETWGPEGKEVPVNGRMWVKVR